MKTVINRSKIVTQLPTTATACHVVIRPTRLCPHRLCNVANHLVKVCRAANRASFAAKKLQKRQAEKRPIKTTRQTLSFRRPNDQGGKWSTESLLLSLYFLLTKVPFTQIFLALRSCFMILFMDECFTLSTFTIYRT